MHHLNVSYDPHDWSLGHFERRVAFGQDTDLCQVRVEFDGEQLRVNIPRRDATWWRMVFRRHAVMTRSCLS